MSIADEQIARQLLGQTRVEVHFTDTRPDYLSLFDQDGGTWIKPAFFHPRRIPRDLFEDLVGQFTGEQQFNTDPDVIRSGLKYDDFYNRYYNSLPK